MTEPALLSGQVHPASLELLERLETGAVLLLAPFVHFRDGVQSRHLVDVSELDHHVSLALDIHGWLGHIQNVLDKAGNAMEEVGSRRRGVALHEAAGY